MSVWKSRSAKVVLLLAGLLSAPTSAWATSITIRTGVDAGGSVLGFGAIDSFWTISVQGGAFAAAKVNPVSTICCGMETVGGQAMWITDPSVANGSSVTGWGAGAPPGEAGAGPLAKARFSFDLTGFDLSTVSFSGNWRVADFRAGVYLNGTLVDPTTTDTAGGMGCDPCNWQVDQAFALAAGSPLFLAGLNTLELRGSSVNSQFDGFWLDSRVDGTLVDGVPTVVPEPGTIALLGTGIVLIARRVRRRQTVS